MWRERRSGRRVRRANILFGGREQGTDELGRPPLPQLGRFVSQQFQPRSDHPGPQIRARKVPVHCFLPSLSCLDFIEEVQSVWKAYWKARYLREAHVEYLSGTIRQNNKSVSIRGQITSLWPVSNRYRVRGAAGSNPATDIYFCASSSGPAPQKMVPRISKIRQISAFSDHDAD